jgi:hypothetical protein
MLVFHDYECNNGHRQIDVENDSNKVRRTIDCDQCDEQAAMLFITSNFIHNSHSSMYGKFHAGFGEVVESYSHKQELLKKYNVVESADSVGGSRCHINSDVTNATPSDTPAPSFGDTPEEAVALAEKAYNEGAE